MTRFALVLGFPRSGGTLLRRILDQHPDVSCPAEPWLTTACARFLTDIAAEGVPIGVRTGLGFAGIAEAEVTEALRGLLFRFHAQMAQGKPVWVEKSGFDLFHLPALADLLVGHARFICLVRHPLDVIASNLDLAARMGRFMPEMDPYFAQHPIAIEALAAAWADRTQAMLDFAAAQGEAAVVARFEDLVADPVATLAPVFGLLDVAAMDAAQIAAAVVAPARPGLGDWKQGGEGLTAAPVGRWTKTIPRRSAAGLMDRLGPLMARLNYEVLPQPRRPTRADAIRQMVVAARLPAGPKA